MSDTPAEDVKPALICVYGKSGLGKTTDMCYSFPRAVFFAEPNALLPARRLCGYVPDWRPLPNTIQGLTDEIQKLPPGVDIVVDDMSYLADKTVDHWRTSLSGFDLWRRVREELGTLRKVARDAHARVAFNAWLVDPKPAQDGRPAQPGGPKLPGQMASDFPAICDVVLRGGVNTARKPWGGIYECRLLPNWTMKDRYDLAPKITPIPMNLAELLRAVGEHVERHPDLPWQEDVVAQFADTLYGTPAAKIVAQANSLYAELIAADVPASAARWTVRDALDRATIRRAVEQSDKTFF